MLTELLATVEAPEFLRAIRTSPILFPLTNGAHILAFAVLVGSIAVYDSAILRSGLLRAARIGANVLPIAWTAFALATATGAVLFAMRATHYAGNPAFLLMLAFQALACLNVLGLHRQVSSGRLAATLSLALWVAIVLAGRWIGFA